MLTLPSWSVAVIASLFVAVLTFAWRLAERASRSADKLDAATTRLVALEGRIAVIATIETGLALLRQEVSHLAERVDDQSKEITSLRESRHKHASDVQALSARMDALHREVDRVSSTPTPVHGIPRPQR